MHEVDEMLLRGGSADPSLFVDDVSVIPSSGEVATNVWSFVSATIFKLHSFDFTVFLPC